jgi:hypothetical protein
MHAVLLSVAADYAVRVRCREGVCVAHVGSLLVRPVIHEVRAEGKLRQKSDKKATKKEQR